MRVASHIVPTTIHDLARAFIPRCPGAFEGPTHIPHLPHYSSVHAHNQITEQQRSGLSRAPWRHRPLPQTRPTSRTACDRASLGAFVSLYWGFVTPASGRERCAVFFTIQELELRKVHFDVSFAPGEIDYLDPELRQVSTLKTEGQAELLGNTLGEVRVTGHLEVTMGTDCDRCLEQARYDISSDFDLYYRPTSKAEGFGQTEDVEIDEGEAEIAYYEGDRLDLKEILREHVLLSMPMQRVCEETCKGICPVCGKNRNTNACHCETRLEDDRWAALKNLTTRGI